MRVGHKSGGGYDGRHLFGNGFGGGEYTNLTASGGGDSFYNLENQWRALLKADPNVKIEVDIQPHNAAGSTVPEAFEFKHAIDGGEIVKKVFLNE